MNHSAARTLLELNARQEAEARRKLGAKPLTGPEANSITAAKGNVGRRAARNDN